MGDIHRAIKSISKYLSEHEQIRHTLIHRHSLIDSDLNNFEHIEDQEQVRTYKYIRSDRLKRYLSDKKQEFREINDRLFTLIDELFLLLKPEYERQKKIVG